MFWANVFIPMNIKTFGRNATPGELHTSPTATPLVPKVLTLRYSCVKQTSPRLQALCYSLFLPSVSVSFFFKNKLPQDFKHSATVCSFLVLVSLFSKTNFPKNSSTLCSFLVLVSLFSKTNSRHFSFANNLVKQYCPWPLSVCSVCICVYDCVCLRAHLAHGYVWTRVNVYIRC